MAKICIVSHFAYGAFSGGEGGHAGGVERQTTLMANWLSENGHKVSLITWDEGQPDASDLNGIINYKICRQNKGIPVVRFFYPRWTSLIHALRRADANLYYHNCAEYVTGQVAIWCKLNKRKFVFSVPSDPDCDAQLPKMNSLREKVLYKYGIRNADKLIVQTMTQQKMLKEGFGLSSTVIPMPCPVPVNPPGTDKEKRGGGKPTIIWVGRISREKQLELLLDVAESLPDLQFSVAGKPNEEDAYIKDVLGRANNLNNVELLGMVPRDGMDDLYRNAALLCCTSHYEGFPNTFLEAWSHGVPVVSTVDPDDVIQRHELGKVVFDKESCISAILELVKSSEIHDQYSNNARSYFMANHTLDVAMNNYSSVFEEVLAGE